MRNRTPVICVILYCRDIRDGGVSGSGCDGEVGTGCTHISRSGASFVLLIQRLVLLSSQRNCGEIILVEYRGVSVGCGAVGEGEPGRGYVWEEGGGGIGGGPGAGGGEILEGGEGG